MQNYLSTRYRRVYDKIKEARSMNFKGKLPKSIMDVKMILNGLSSSTNVGKDVVKFPYELTSKIVQFPYVHYWRKYWLVKCSTITMFILMPAFYNLYKFKKSENSNWPYKKDVNELCELRKEVEAKPKI
uniref:Uncharacterized protein n=1 Tax=Vespula pensylvanica TaxID=30213 RepID=A0A834UHY3_VESPE|nr:hypothetical protein H0235_001758 [Vespula pensylvanica]